MQCSRKLGHGVSRDRVDYWLQEADILGSIGKALKGSFFGLLKRSKVVLKSGDLPVLQVCTNQMFLLLSRIDRHAFFNGTLD